MNKLDKLLIKHNICPGYSGFTYIKYILKTTDEDISTAMITKLYTLAAFRHHSTTSRVERAIRHIITKSDLKGSTNKRALAFLQLEYKELKNEI